MTKWIPNLLAVLVHVAASVADGVAADDAGSAFALTEGTTLRFARLDEGRAILGRHDRFIAALSPWDRQARMRTDRDVSTEDFVAFVSGEALAWEAPDRQKLVTVLEQVRERLRPWSLRLPSEILLVLTTGREEGGAAYCRGNAIVLSRRIAATSTVPALTHLLLHEMFHLMTAHDVAGRERLYGVIGFFHCGRVELPPDLAARKITNPDAPAIEHAVEIEVEGKSVTVVPLLLADSPRYPAVGGRVFFEHMQFRLLEVRRDGRGGVVPVLHDGRPRLIEPTAAPSYHEKIGRNTGYIIHPEEILAENFALLLLGSPNVRSPHVLEGLKKVLADSTSR